MILLSTDDISVVFLRNFELSVVRDFRFLFSFSAAETADNADFRSENAEFRSGNAEFRSGQYCTKTNCGIFIYPQFLWGVYRQNKEQ